MKKIKMLAAALVAGVAALGLASCSAVSESYAEKINDAAADKEYITYDEVKDKLGDEAVDITIAKTGVIVAVKGCKSIDDIKAKIDEGKDVKGIVITVALGNATGAVFKTITADDLK